MDFKIKETLNCKNSSRSDFLTKMSRMLLDKLTYAHRELIVLMIEMLKNIHDHTNGRGEIYIKKTDSYIEFEIRDYGRDSFDIKSLSKRGVSAKKDTGVNFGAGLGTILDPKIHKGIGLKLKLDASCGFKYTGKYFIKVLDRESGSA